MAIRIITEKEYKLLQEMQKNYPTLTFQNDGLYSNEYKGYDESILTDEDKDAIAKINDILKEAIDGFIEFHNFRITKGQVMIRMNCYWTVEEDDSNYKLSGIRFVYLDRLYYGTNWMDRCIYLLD